MCSNVLFNALPSNKTSHSALFMASHRYSLKISINGARSDKTFIVFKLGIRYFEDNRFCIRVNLMA